MLSAIVSIGTTGVTVLSLCTSFGGSGVVPRDIVGSVVINAGSFLETPFHTNNPLGCLSLIRFIYVSKSS